MDLHPAPVPVAKRRVSVKPTLKSSMVGPNAKKEKPTQPVVPAKPRPKRAFGVSRNTNIPVEKAQLKQHKPASATANLAKRTGNTTENAKLTPTGSKKQLQKIHLKEDKEKKKVDAMQIPIERKKQLQEVHLKEDKDKRNAMRTPLAVTKKVVEDGTPYFSALNCSKCRLDRLETSSYWLNQIRLSEAVGKHFVSAAFFRLALECHAQPFEKIRSELKRYSKRHQTTSTISLFDDLLQSYGLPVEKIKTEHSSILISEPNEASLLFDSHKDESEGTFTLEEEHDCNSNQGSCPDISPEQPENKPKQDEIVKLEHCEVENTTEEVDDKLKSDNLKEHSNSTSDNGTRKELNKYTPTRDALSTKTSTACLEKSSLTKKAGNSANELSKNEGKQAAENEKTECISTTKDEVVSLIDSVVT